MGRATKVWLIELYQFPALSDREHKYGMAMLTGVPAQIPEQKPTEAKGGP